MSTWFSFDSNKFKELATNTLINAQKQIGLSKNVSIIFGIDHILIPNLISSRQSS